MVSFYTDLVESFDLDLQFRGSSIMLRMPHPYGEPTPASLFAFEKGGRVYNTKFLAGLRKWGFNDEQVAKITGDFWQGLNKIDTRFLKDGISHASTGSFLPLPDLLDRLTDIKKEISKVVSRVRAEYDSIN